MPPFCACKGISKTFRNAVVNNWILPSDVPEEGNRTNTGRVPSAGFGYITGFNTGCGVGDVVGVFDQTAVKVGEGVAVQERVGVGVWVEVIIDV